MSKIILERIINFIDFSKAWEWNGLKEFKLTPLWNVCISADENT